MSDVVALNNGSSQPPKFEDDWILKMCIEWRVARLEQQKNWALHELATMWGTLPDREIKLDLEPLRRMQEFESRLSAPEPRTMLCARELLGVVNTILAHAVEDPEATLASGPVLEIVRNVTEALGHCEHEMRLRAD
jgi:hypothetical protein